MGQIAAQEQEHSVFDDPPLAGETAEQAQRRRQLWFKIARIYQRMQEPTGEPAEAPAGSGGHATFESFYKTTSAAPLAQPTAMFLPKS